MSDRCKFLLFNIILLLFYCSPLAAVPRQSTSGSIKKQAIVLSRLQGPIELDGFSDEPAWQTVKPFPVVMHTPRFGAIL